MHFRIAIISLFTAFGTTFITAQTPFQYPTLPASGKSLRDFVPKGWRILAEAVGDLNKDKRDDLAAVLESEKPVQGLKMPDMAQTPRILIAALQQADGSYRLSVRADSAILLSDEGGIFGDPWDNLSINRGSILTSFYGGSSDRWGYVYRWRLEPGGWTLIGATYTESSTFSNKATTYDFNLLTGMGEITKSPGKKKKLVLQKKWVIGLDRFVPMQTEIYPNVFI